jgi:hypothetical protein
VRSPPKNTFERELVACYAEWLLDQSKRLPIIILDASVGEKDREREYFRVLGEIINYPPYF